MLRWLHNIDWLQINTSALVLIVAIQVLSWIGFQNQPEGRSPQATTEQKTCENSVCKTFWERTFSDPVATFTLVLAIGTGALFLIGLGQGKLINRQLNLARDEFISSNRPKLIVRDVHAPKRDPGQKITVKFSLVNVGQTRATLNINAINIVYHAPGSSELVLPPKAAGRRDLPVTVIEPGGQQSFKLKTAANLKWNDETLRVQASEAVGVFLEGKVIYLDDREVPRRLVFRYQWQGFHTRFRRIPDPDYEDG